MMKCISLIKSIFNGCIMLMLTDIDTIFINSNLSEGEWNKSSAVLNVCDYCDMLSFLERVFKLVA